MEERVEGGGTCGERSYAMTAVGVREGTRRYDGVSKGPC